MHRTMQALDASADAHYHTCDYECRALIFSLLSLIIIYETFTQQGNFNLSGWFHEKYSADSTPQSVDSRLDVFKHRPTICYS